MSRTFTVNNDSIKRDKLARMRKLQQRNSSIQNNMNRNAGIRENVNEKQREAGRQLWQQTENKRFAQAAGNKALSAGRGEKMWSGTQQQYADSGSSRRSRLIRRVGRNSRERAALELSAMSGDDKRDFRSGEMGKDREHQVDMQGARIKSQEKLHGNSLTHDTNEKVRDRNLRKDLDTSETNRNNARIGSHERISDKELGLRQKIARGQMNIDGRKHADNMKFREDELEFKKSQSARGYSKTTDREIKDKYGNVVEGRRNVTKETITYDTPQRSRLAQKKKSKNANDPKFNNAVPVRKGLEDFQKKKKRR